MCQTLLPLAVTYSQNPSGLSLALSFFSSRGNTQEGSLPGPVGEIDVRAPCDLSTALNFQDSQEDRTH